MNIKSISLSYVFLVICVISLLISLYFKIIVIKTSPGRRDRNRLIGDMKDPITWRERNNIISYLFVFWATVSLSIFIYLKFFNTEILISILYLFAYIVIILVSVVFSILKKKAVA